MSRNVHRTSMNNLQQELNQSQRQNVQNKRLLEFIRRLHANDPDLKRLDFRNVSGTLSTDNLEGGGTKGSLLYKLLQALGGCSSSNTTITSVNVMMRFLKDLSRDDMVLFFKTLGSMPALEHLRVGSSGFGGLPLQLVTRTLEAPCCQMKLKALQLHHFSFRGTIHYPRRAEHDSTMNTMDDEFVAFCGALQRMQGLEFCGLEDMEAVFDLNAVVRSVVRLPKLTSLHFKSLIIPNEAQLSPESLQRLCASETIESLQLRRLHLVPFIPQMTQDWQRYNNSVLKSLNLEDNQIDAACAEAIAKLLQANDCMTGLSVLKLGYNMIPDEGGIQIVRAVAKNRNSRLERLELQANMMGVGTANALADGFRNALYPALKHLVLSQNELGNSGCQEMAQALWTNTTLQTLALAEIAMGDESCTSLSKLFATNTTLQHLNISDNKVTNVGCKIFANEGLSRNGTLRSLSLNVNKIGNQGALALASTLETTYNDTLEHLNLVGNEMIMGQKVYQAFASLLQKNMSLKELWIPVGGGGEDESMMEFYLKLNRIGRRDLLRTSRSNLTDWVKAFVVSSEKEDDLNVLYYFVRSNPAVFDVTNWAVA
jgi:Ran GTPase-activating protein (RanGAP) involved in mRNA processing and transport